MKLGRFFSIWIYAESSSTCKRQPRMLTWSKEKDVEKSLGKMTLETNNGSAAHGTLVENCGKTEDTWTARVTTGKLVEDVDGTCREYFFCTNLSKRLERAEKERGPRLRKRLGELRTPSARRGAAITQTLVTEKQCGSQPSHNLPGKDKSEKLPEKVPRPLTALWEQTVTPPTVTRRALFLIRRSPKLWSNTGAQRS